MFSSRISFYSQGIPGSGYINVITADNGIGIVPTSDGNTVYATSFDGTGTNTGNIVLFKLNSSGNITWQYELAGNVSDDYAYAIAIDSSQNIYLGGFTNNNGQGNNDMYLVKYDSTGNLLWQKTLGTTVNDNYRSISIESGANGIFASGRANNDAVTIKYDNTGNIIWQKQVPLDVTFVSSDIDSTGNIYFLSQEDASVVDNYVRLGKWYSNGTHIWTRILSSDVDLIAADTTIDNSNNPYVMSRNSNDGQLNIVKYNSSGTVQWQIKSDVIVSQDFSKLTSDGSNIYLATTLSGNNQSLIVKFNSSGSIVWQRFFKGNPETIYINDLSYANNFIYIAATSTYTTTNSSVFLKFKVDGTGTGTYGNYSYTESTITFSTGNLTSGIQTSDDSDPGLTAGTGNLTSTASSFTQTITST